MSEPAGIATRLNISATSLNIFLNCTQAETEKFFEIEQSEIKTSPEKKVSVFMAELLYSCNQGSQNVFLFHYNIKKNELFFAYILNYNWLSMANSVLSILKQLSSYQDLSGENYALCFSPVSMDFFNAFVFQKGNTLNNNPSNTEQIVKEYTDTFWKYFDKNAECFPIPEIAIKKKDYYYKPIIIAYKNYLEVIKAQLKPEIIKKATAQNPFHLFEYLYTWGEKVYNCMLGFENAVEVKHADPLTIKKIGKVYADKNFVYKCNFISISNRSFFIVNGIDGASYRIIGGNTNEYLYSKDKNFVYYLDEIRIPEADVKTFKYIDFAYAKDKNHVYYQNTIIPICSTEYILDKHGFIRDKKNIFHYGEKILMDAITFKVLSYESDTNPFMGVFVLQDINGTNEYDSINKTFKKIV